MTTPTVPSIPELAERLRELDAKATPGPWEADEAVAVNRHPDIYAGRAGLIAEVGNAELGVEDQWEANAALIVALRNSLPEIISALEDLSRLKAGEEWQPIETCPRGIAVLVSDGETAVIGSLTLGSGWEFAGRPLASQPTLWHRLPTPPARGGNPPEGWTGDIIDD